MARSESEFTKHGSPFDDASRRVRAIICNFPVVGRRRNVDTSGSKEVVGPFRVEPIFHPAEIIPILSSGYGIKKWNRTDERYWRGESNNWEYQVPKPDSKQLWSDRTKKAYKELRTVLEWACDEETRRHLDPAPGVPIERATGKIAYNIPTKDDDERFTTRVPNWDDPIEVDYAIADLARYYFNSGEAQKILPLAAHDLEGNLVSIETIRKRGDPWAPKGSRIACIERFMTDPTRRGEGAGNVLFREGLRIIFSELNFPEARLWVMTDNEAGDSNFNMRFFGKFGFERLKHPDKSWKTYLQRRGKYTKRDAAWLKLDEEKYKMVV